MNPVLSVGAYLIVSLLILLGIWLGVRAEYGTFEGPTRIWLIRFGTLFYLLFMLLPVGGAFLPDSPFKFRVQAAGNIWLGFFGYFSIIFIILCILHGLYLLVRKRKGQGGFLGRALLISLAAGAVLLIYGMIHAQDTKVTEYDIMIDKDSGTREDYKLVLIADLHLSVNSRLSTTQKMVEMVNRENPDAVLIAGDIFTSSYRALDQPEKYQEALRGIETKYGVFAVYGNHDVEETLFGGFPISPISAAFRTKEMEEFITGCGFTVLYDEIINIADGRLQIVGRVDGEKAGDGTADRKSPSEVLSGTDPGRPVIVLQHEPVEFAPLKENGADLALCGHTHAGQIFPGNLIVPFFNENAYGYKVVSGLDTVVTSGVGYYGPPMRVGTDSEITVLNLHVG